MKRTVKGLNIIRAEKLKGDFSFSANNKDIKLISYLYDKESSYLDDEAIKAREEYIRLVGEAKQKGEKVNPTKCKKEALCLAKDYILGQCGEEVYNNLHGCKTTIIKGESKDVIKVKEVNVEEVKSTNEDFQLSMYDLVSEFDNNKSTEVKLKVEVSEDESNIFDSEFSEDVVNESPIEDLSIFDVDISVDDILSL